MPLTKPWQTFDPADTRRLPGATGVFELAAADGHVLYVGFAGGKSRFGLRGEIAARMARLPEACMFRFEVNTMYLTRYVELLETYLAANGDLPAANHAHGEYIPGVIQRRLRASKGA